MITNLNKYDKPIDSEFEKICRENREYNKCIFYIPYKSLRISSITLPPTVKEIIWNSWSKFKFN